MHVDDEYMNAAAAHAAFLMTVSAAMIQHARDIDIHKLHPLPEKIGLGRSFDFLQWNTPFNVYRIFAPCVNVQISHRFSQGTLDSICFQMLFGLNTTRKLTSNGINN